MASDGQARHGRSHRLLQSLPLALRSLALALRSLALAALLSALALAPCPARGEDLYASQRHSMVQQQIRARAVTDTLVLAAMEQVPRHEFVPETDRNHAYEDRPL